MPDKECQTPWIYNPDNYDYHLARRDSPSLNEEDFQYGDDNNLPQSSPVSLVAATEGWGDESTPNSRLIEFLLDLYEVVYPMVIASFTFQYDDKATQTPSPHLPHAEGDSDSDFYFE